MTPTLELEHETPHSGIGLNEVLFAIFKHKWKIVAGSIVAIIAAIVVQVFWPTLYQSEAKLLVRYVVDRTPVDPVENQSGQTSGFGRTSEKIINSEVEILTSWDLAKQVAETIGPKRLLPDLGDAATVPAAAGTIIGGLDVGNIIGSDVISVAYKNKDPELAVLVLDELVSSYSKKHLEVHRSAAAFDFVGQQADQARMRVNATEAALKDLKAKVGITSTADNTATLNADLIKIEDQYAGAQSELVEQQARVKQIEDSYAFGGSPSSKQNKPHVPRALPVATPQPATPEDVLNYQALAAHLLDLRKARLELMAKYQPGSEAVRINQADINNTEQQKQEMEKKFPDLIGQAPNGTGQPSQLDLQSERARLAGIQARTEALKARMEEKIKQLSDVGSQIADLERKRDIEETNYKNFQSALEKARVDEALDPNRMPNISAVQKPSPPKPVVGKRNKVLIMIGGGGIALSIGLAVLFELVLNRTVKRPLELERQLKAPLMLSIPYSRPMKRLQGPRRKSNGNTELMIPGNGDGAIASWEVDHFIRPYCEAIRDRLNLYFEINRMTHKPKLVGVTGFEDGAGSSTLAAGLAASLSEMGDGKVLLVDVNLGVGRVHPFFEGKPAYPLSRALQPAESIDSASENLYLATVSPPGAGPMQIALKRFFELMPNLKASDFDYIIFDMPPLNETNPTLGMARFMDKVLLVVEAEKTGREAAKRGYTQLSAARANVSVILNKARSYLPKVLNGEA